MTERCVQNIWCMEKTCKRCTHCFICETGENLDLRILTWEYRPKRKYIAKGDMGGMTDFNVVLCDDCNRGCEEIYLIGWDWWDAADGLDLRE